MPEDLKRLLNNIVQTGRVSATKSKEGKALAKVIVSDDGEEQRISKFLPVVSFANSFVRVFFPLRVGEQVVVIYPMGIERGGFILRSIFNRNCKEPSGAMEHTAVMEFEDGTRLSYDTESKDLKIDAVNSINVICKSATVTADSTTINSTSTHNGDVTVNGKLTVTELITGGNGLAISGGGATGGATFDCDLTSTKNIEAENLKARSSVTDSKGSLTDHTNNGMGRD